MQRKMAARRCSSIPGLACVWYVLTCVVAIETATLYDDNISRTGEEITPPPPRTFYAHRAIGVDGSSSELYREVPGSPRSYTGFLGPLDEEVTSATSDASPKPKHTSPETVETIENTALRQVTFFSKVNPSSTPVMMPSVDSSRTPHERPDSSEEAVTEPFHMTTVAMSKRQNGRNDEHIHTPIPGPAITQDPHIKVLDSDLGTDTGSSTVERCPSTCFCERDEKGVVVKCTSHLWRETPPLPPNTYRFTMESPKIPVMLHNNSFSGNRTHLQWIKFRNAEITHFGCRAFENIPLVNKIEFTNNKLKSLHADLFKMNSNLEMLSLIYNEFVTVPHSALCKALGLVRLRLQKNLISRASFVPCFMSLVKLTNLDLRDNPIQEIMPNDFYFLRNSSLRNVYMDGCLIRRLSDGIFRHLPKLSYVSFSRNNITHIPPLIFQNMTYLKVIILSKNRIFDFEFVWALPRLVALDIQKTGIESLSVLQKGQLSMLEKLHLSGNRLTNLINYTFTPLGLNNVDEITLDSCNLRLLEAHSFHGLPCLRNLKLSRNPLTSEMLSRGLQGLSNSPLEVLSLQGLKLGDLNNKTFAPLGESNLTKLYLDNCGIKRLRNGVFGNLERLLTLSLSNNKIIEVEQNTFLPLRYLESLTFNRNQLTECLNVKKTALSSSVLRINMESNRISQINFLCIRGLAKLISYSFFGNTLEKIGAKTFIGSNLTSLSLRKNKLSSLSNNTYSYMNQLSTLNLAGNTIQLVDTGCFDGLHELEHLRLSDNPLLGNKITRLAVAFLNLHSLNSLIFDNCGVNELPVHIFTNMKQLKKLNLQRNALVTWHSDLFLHQQKLQTLYLQRNRIVTLNSDMFKYVPNLQEIHLHGNPFACSCDITWFRSWISGGSVFAYMDITKEHSYQCASPPEQEGTSLLQLDLSFDKCGPKEAVIGGVVGGLFFALLLLSAVMTYRYRWYIRYGYFLLQRRIRARRNDIGNDEEFAYDAFVSYNHRDQQWVIEQLLPALEYRGGVRLCLHDRDWIAGCTIADNIIESIESSRKTVLVLTNNFARSEWCQLEMSMAQHKLLTTRKDVLVLIMMGPVDDVHMSKNLRHLISTQTYLAWDANDAEKQSLFWKALIKALKNERNVVRF